jgi:ABC-type enterochelin transport system ATPase subunit
MAQLMMEAEINSAPAALEMEESAFIRQQAELFECYEGQFVAMYDGNLVGHGKDDEQLASDIFQRFGDVPFFIAKVEQSPTVYELASPEFGA